MLRATIRSGDEALHFLAELDPYNVQTLQYYVRSLMRDRGTVTITVDVHGEQPTALQQRLRGWLSRIAALGAHVHITPEAVPHAVTAVCYTARPPDLYNVSSAGPRPTRAATANSGGVQKPSLRTQRRVASPGILQRQRQAAARPPPARAGDLGERPQSHAG